MPRMAKTAILGVLKHQAHEDFMIFLLFDGRMESGGAMSPSPPPAPASGAALGLHPCIALSSDRPERTVPFPALARKRKILGVQGAKPPPE
jgi:hypothetical protein